MCVPTIRILVLPRVRVLLTIVRAVPVVRLTIPVPDRITNEKGRRPKEVLTAITHRWEDRSLVPLITAVAVLLPPEAVTQAVEVAHAHPRAVLPVRVVEEAAAEADDECDYGIVCTKSRNYDEEIFYSHMRVITDLGCWRTECV